VAAFYALAASAERFHPIAVRWLKPWWCFNLNTAMVAGMFLRLTFFLSLFLTPNGIAMTENLKKFKVANWYDVTELKKDVFIIREPADIDASFFILKLADKALLIDSGIGLSEKVAKQLLEALKIKQFDVINTHAHFDHVGLNHLAKKVYMSRSEWEKFQRLDEKTQLARFLKMDNSSRPEGFDPKMKRTWKPTVLIESQKPITLGSFTLIPTLSPGHTEGHVLLLEPKLNLLFIGDLVYDGLLYLHLKDSSLSKYEESIKSLVSMISKLSNPILLPCHNSIPLDAGYPKKVLTLIEKIKSKKLKPTKEEPANTLFQKGAVYEYESVKLILGTSAN
jgi:glyoxylase-like metal-dependent hydrolase (beta-lactamase superfamily II)